MQKFKIMKDDIVVVTTGKHKKETGKVLKVLRDKNRVLIEKVNVVKRQVKPTAERAGGTVEKEASIHISNVAHVDPESGKATRIKYEVKDGVKRRLSVISGALLDK